mgnify:CR=1 FL=1
MMHVLSITVMWMHENIKLLLIIYKSQENFEVYRMNNNLRPVKLSLLYDLIINYDTSRPLSINDVLTILKTKSVSKARNYLTMAKWFIKTFGVFRGTYAEFKNILQNFLNKTYHLSEIIREMAENQMPANFLSLLEIAHRKGLKINEKEARTLFAFAREFGILSISYTSVYTPTPEEEIYIFIRNKGIVPLSVLERKFSNTRELILKLWREEKIDIEGLEDLRSKLKQIDDFDKIPVQLIPTNSRFFSVWEDPVSGKKFASLIFPHNTKVKIRWS